MYDHPGELHTLMAFLRDGYLSKLDFWDNSGLLTPNNNGAYVGSGGFGWSDELPGDTPSRVKGMWGLSESQETAAVSGEMFEEFVLPYQKPLMERLGLVCYGCCEPLDHRWNALEKIPNLRRVSVSPWSDTAKMAEMLGSRYVYSLKPNPAGIAVPAIDEDAIRAGLRKTLQATARHGCPVEIIMKDCHTFGGNPSNPARWCAIALEEAHSV
jgi:hypothetical protein